MEFYIIGAVFIVAGLGVKALASKRRWIKVPRSRRTLSDVLMVSIGASVYLFSLVIFLLLVGLFEAIGFSRNSAVGPAWFSTVFLVLISCILLGWKMGPDPTQRAKMPDRFAEDPDNPFGAPDRPEPEFDVRSSDSDKH